ncbi:MAG: tetratricopeptide repeat protein [Hyphomonadaceae bacterium]
MHHARTLAVGLAAFVLSVGGVSTPAFAQLALPPGAELWPQQCESGDPDACINQGIRYQQGIEIQASWGDAAKYWGKACKLGVSDGCQMASEVYSGLADGFPADYPRLVAVEASGCKLGMALQCADAALRLYSGDGVSQNVELALPLFAKACDLKDALACAIAATEYLDGEQGTPIDAQKAVVFGKKGCALEQQDACLLVESAYMLPKYATFEPQAGFEYALKNCADNSGASCSNLGNVYVEIKEYELGVENYDKACKLGVEEACTVAGNFRTWLTERAAYEAWLAQQAERKAQLNQLISGGNLDGAMRAALFDYGSTDLAEYVAGKASDYKAFSTNNLYVLSLWFPGKAVGAAADKELSNRGTGLEGRFGEGTNAPGMAAARYRAAYGSSPPTYTANVSSPSLPKMPSAAEISAQTREKYRWAHCTMKGSNTSAKICQ